MPTFIALLDFTDQGIRNLKDSPQRADAFREQAEKGGAEIIGQYWTIGSHDGVLIVEAPTEERVAALLLRLASEGNVRTTTLRAFDWGEAQEMIGSG